MNYKMNKFALSDTLNGWSVEKSEELYGVHEWGAGYFSISSKGEMQVNTKANDNTVSVSMMDIISGIVERGMGMPVLLRLENILDSRITQLNECFRKIFNKVKYQGQYLGVFPIKVNQQSQVIEEITKFGVHYHHGLEAGSKAELIIAMSKLKDPKACLICNGYKDEEFIDLSLYATKLGLNCFFVIEMVRELSALIERSKDLGIIPQIGVRIKLSTKASGRWGESGGDRSLFGLTVSEIIDVVDVLKKENMLDCLKLLHYHIGSQITNIRDIRQGIAEACQIYSELVLEGAPMGYLDMGGGLAVDYDGSHTNFPCSRNYSLQEYCEDIVEIIMYTMNDKRIAHPNIITESGRATVAYYSVLLFNILEISSIKYAEIPNPLPEKRDEMLDNLKDVLDRMNVKNLQECYNDAIYYNDQLKQLFRHGKISLRERAIGETIFWNILLTINQLATKLKRIPTDLDNLEAVLSDIYYGNFSVFQSVPDIWAIDQLFPVMPLHRLTEFPGRNGIIADITCDCDGQINKFIDSHDVKHFLPLHPFKENEEYYMGIFLIGAYQETLGDIHNLLGDSNVVSVRITGNNSFDINREQEGDTVSDVLDYVGYYSKQLLAEFKNKVELAIKDNKITVPERRNIMNAYELGLRGYTYFEK